MVNMEGVKKVVLTGGHAASSAFVVAEEIIRQKKPWKLFWIGFRSSVEGENISTLSSLYFPKYGIKTCNIIAGRLQRKWTVHTIPSLLKIPLGFIQAFFVLLKIKPDIVLSFGGFSAFPVVVWAYILGIPVIIHEQTSVAGRANIYSSFFAKKIALSRQSSQKYFPVNKTVITGNPVPKDIKTENVSDSPGRKILFVTGGQSGSVALNNAVEKILVDLLAKYQIIHLTGLKDEDKFKNINARFPANLKKYYQVYGIVDPKKFNEFFNSSSVLISRAGANTVSKIVLSGRPSVLIPLPISYMNEQQENAEYAKKYSTVRIIKQEELNPENLLTEIEYLIKNGKKVKKAQKKEINPDIQASEKIVAILSSYLK